MERKRFKVELYKLLFVALCYCICQNFLNSILAIYVTGLGFGAYAVGFMSLSFAVFAVITRLAAGVLSDILSRRLVLIIGCLIYSAALLFFGVIPYLAPLLLIRGFQGAGYSASNTAASTICVDISPADSVNTYMSLLWGVNVVAICISGFTAQYSLNTNNYNVVFVALAVLLFLAFLVTLFMRPKEQVSAQPTNRRSKTTVKLSDIIEPKALPAFAVFLFLAISHSSLGIYVLAYAEQLGITKIAGSYNLAVAVAMAVGAVTSPKIIKKVGHLLPLVSISTLFCGALLIIAFSKSLGAFYFGGISFGLLVGITFPLLNALAVKNLPYNRRGKGSGTVLLAADIGVGIGSFACGALIDLSGYKLMFIISAVCAAVAVVLAIVLFRTKSKNEVVHSGI